MQTKQKKVQVKKHRHKWEEHECGCPFCIAQDLECNCGATKDYK